MQATEIHYGLKQASRSWNKYFDKIIKIYSFVKNEEESCIYKWANGSMIIFFILYIDDILLIRNDIPTLQNMKLSLLSQFFMKNLKEVSYILEMKICRDRFQRLLGLSQSMYIDTILKRFNMKDSKKDYLLIGQGIFFKKRLSDNFRRERAYE